ncbi:hypothetical protein HAL07_06940 [Helicobacter ailurogastricus]|uniref:Uncharacterized protein n=1 Tax=Helicobacter ailurogastricus TaxID=1578720 RepID=A0A0K2Y8P0_9HELI|nr:hypothetical protein HAL07_06940 [Helicobacter ailurogastricus]
MWLKTTAFIKHFFENCPITTSFVPKVGQDGVKILKIPAKSN